MDENITSFPNNNKFNNSLDIDNKKRNSKNKKIISTGICSRFYLYILYSALFKFLSLILLGRDTITTDDIGLFGFCPILYKFNFIQSIYIYIGYIIFGIIFYKYKEVDKNREEIQEALRREAAIENKFIYYKTKKSLRKKR